MLTPELKIWIEKIGIIILFLLTGYVLYKLGGVVFILVMSGFFTLLLDGTITTWERKKVSPWITLSIIYILVFIGLLLIVSTVLPIFVEYITKGIGSFTTWTGEVQAAIHTGGIKSLGLHPYIERILEFIIGRIGIEEIFTIIKENAGSIQTFVTTQLSNITSGGISIIGNVGSAMTESIFIAIMTFLMVLERHTVGKFLLMALPKSGKLYVEHHLEDMAHILHSWVRGQMKLGVAIFSIVLVGLTIIEMVFGVSSGKIWTLAIIAGIMEFIPYIGPIISLIPALVVGLGFSWEMGLTILVFYIIVQQLENNILVPYVMSKSLDLSPLYVFVVMLAGGVLGGILGIILAIPVAAILRLVTLDYIKNREKIDNAPETNTLKKVVRKTTNKI